MSNVVNLRPEKPFKDLPHAELYVKLHAMGESLRRAKAYSDMAATELREAAKNCPDLLHAKAITLLADEGYGNLRVFDNFLRWLELVETQNPPPKPPSNAA